MAKKGSSGARKPYEQSMFVTNLLYLMRRDKLNETGIAEKSAAIREPGIPVARIQHWIRSNAKQPTFEYRGLLAEVFGVDNPQRLIDEDLQSANREFERDRRHLIVKNPKVDEVRSDHPEWFEGLTEPEIDEIRQIRAVGGALTYDGVIDQVHRLKLRKEVQRKFEVLIRTGAFETLSTIVNALWDSMQAKPFPDAASQDQARKSS